METGMRQRINRFIPLTIIVLLLTTQSLRSQCSDAGACSIGGGHAGATGHEVAFGYAFGTSSAPDSLTFHALSLGLSLQVHEDSRISITLPVGSQSGPLGSASGIGDLILLWNQTVHT
ncbi:MAG: hypothetical protein WD295_02085, partial [Bacteroidota bacterium]